MFIETEQEADGRWIAEITDVPGCMVYGSTERHAIFLVKQLLRYIIEDEQMKD